MKYLVTGATGFAGPHLAKRLVESGHNVYGSYRGEYDDRFVDVERITGDSFKDILFYKCDLADTDRIIQMVRHFKFDGIFHLGGLTHIPTAFDDPGLAIKINTSSTVTLCNAIWKYCPECILMYCSAGSVYDTYTEPVMIDETFPMSPSNPYGVSKAMSELYISERTLNDGLDAFIVRPFSHTGPGRRREFAIASDAAQIADIVKGDLKPVINVGNLASRRVIMDVRDVVEVYERLMEKRYSGDIENGEIFNIGGDNIHTIGEYLDIMLDICNIKDVVLQTDLNLLRPVESSIQIPDSGKVRKLLDWKPETDIRKILKDLLEYWLKK